ncbi:MAG: toll/interleukin-1 receptor domain-containing protein [Propionivibrio sp.]|nr:toll/interleukin-1 receptor domain-containing protein [Propionivibrio sp.]
MFASLLRYRWLRELRALWPWAAGLLLMALAGQFALTSPRSSINLDSIGALKALPGQAITLRGLAGDESFITYTSGREGSLDLRFDQARLAPETLELLRRVGIAAPDGDAPASWITRAEPGIGAESMSRFEVMAASSGRIPDALLLRVLAGATVRQARLEVVSHGAPLSVSLSLPWTGDAHAPRKILRLGETELVLPGTLPVKLLVPADAKWRAIMTLPEQQPLPAAALTFGAFTGRDGGGLAVAAVGLEAVPGAAAFLACGATAESLLWRAAGRLASGDCPAAPASVRVRSLALRADGADLAVGGNAWVSKDGQPLGEDLLTRLRQQPVWWALLLLVDGLLLAWTLLALLPGPRRIELRGVFISYRRADSGPQVGRLHDRLVEQLGAERVFLDLESIPAGEDFDHFITDSLAKVDIVLAVIGPHWLDVRDTSGRRRLEATDDLVRREIAAALAAGLRVIPVLVGGSSMPTAEHLPPDLADLVRHNAAVIGDRQFLRDADDLIEQLGYAPGHFAGNVRNS